MRLSEFAINRPVTTTVVFIALVVVGAVSLTRLSIDLLPEIDFPSISVFTSYEGVGPEEMETLITRPIEEAVSTVHGIDRVESYSSEGRSRVALRFTWGTSLDAALNDVRAAVERVRDLLPEEADQPVVYKFDLSSFPIMDLTLSGQMEPWRLRHLADKVITYRLERLEGVAAADVRGGQKREIHIDVQSQQLTALGLTARAVADALHRDNINIPAGDVLRRQRKVMVRTLGEFRNLKQIESVVVTRREGRPVHVGDVSTVRDGFEELQNMVFVDGQSGIRISITKLPSANTVEVAARVKEEIERINRDIPGIALRARFDTSEFIEASIANVQQGVLVGALLAVAVLFLFLRSFRATAIVATAIPIAIVGTFALMYLGGFTLNMITFGGLALGTGMLVDSAIVILENIERQRTAGLGPRQAAAQGSAEVAMAIVASTVTTLCIFVPVLFVEGFAGIFFSQMAYVVTFALVCALAVALTLVPMLASRGTGHGTLGARGSLSASERTYGRLLTLALNHPAVVVVLALLAMAGTVGLARYVAVELIPDTDEGAVSIRAELATGTPLERTAQAVKQLQQVVDQQVPEATGTLAVAGPMGFWSTAGENYASMRIRLSDADQRQRSSDDVARALRPVVARLPGMTTRVSATQAYWLFRFLRGGDDRLAVDVLGHDLAQGTALARRVAALLKTVPGVVGVDIDRKEGSQEAAIEVDADRASDVGLSVGEVGQVIATYVQGYRATYFRDGGDEFNVIVRLAEAERHRASQLGQLPLLTPSGQVVHLSDVASIVPREGPLVLNRLNQQRKISVTAGLSGRDLGSVTGEVQQHLAQLRQTIRDRQEGGEFQLVLAGEHEEQQETFRQLLLGFFLALALVYLVMASLFESWLQPVIMLVSVPFAGIGVVVTLLITQTSFNVYSFLGGIVLVGVVVNNAIVLLDYANLLRQRDGLSVREAVHRAAQRRLRPILMTSLTTSLALVPVALGLNEGGEMQAPLARVVIGGLLSSTLVTLLLVPTLYAVVEGFIERIWAKRSAI